MCSRLLRLQWKQDIPEASALISKALEVDDKCEFAYETLGTIEVQRWVCWASLLMITLQVLLFKL